jgi:hypothetical protein
MIESVTNLPTIVQAVLGSAIFWSLLYVGRKTIEGIDAVTSRLDRDKQLGEFFALIAWSDENRGTVYSRRAFFT